MLAERWIARQLEHDSGALIGAPESYKTFDAVQVFSAASTSSSIFFASPNSMRLFSL